MPVDTESTSMKSLTSIDNPNQPQLIDIPPVLFPQDSTIGFSTEQLVLRIRDNLRQRQQTSVTLLEEVSQRQVHADVRILHSTYNLYDAPVISYKPVVGQLLTIVKQLVRKLVAPALVRQSEYNAANNRVVSNLGERVETLEHYHSVLREAAIHSYDDLANSDPLPVYDHEKLSSTIDQDEPHITGWSGVVWDNWQKLIPSQDLRVGPQDPAIHFFRWVWEYRAYLVLLCQLTPQSSILEIGCNHGRTALGLLDYLHPPGQYEGLDIMRAQIEFAQNTLQKDFPHFRFTLADIYNALYNPSGGIQASQYTFPYNNASFDVIYAASVFTHLRPEDMQNYLHETRRVLREDGYCLYSFFVLDYYGGLGTPSCDLYEIQYPYLSYKGVAVQDMNLPEKVIAYRLDVISEMADKAGLEIVRVLPGFWSKNGSISINEQDLVLLRIKAKLELE